MATGGSKKPQSKAEEKHVKSDSSEGKKNKTQQKTRRKDLPNEVLDIIRDFLGKGVLTEAQAKKVFENLARSIVMEGKRCPKNTKDLQFQAEYSKVMHWIETKRDKIAKYKKQWAPYYNDPFEIWQDDITIIRDLYLQGSSKQDQVKKKKD